MKESSPSAAQLSVIVVSFSALPTLQLSLEALAAQIVRLDRPNSALLALRSTSAAAPAASDAAGLGKAPLVEVLVVRAKSKDVMGRMTRAIAELRVQFPWFQWLEVSEGTTVPLMRKHGLERSAGEIIALVEDDCIVAGNWCLDLLRAHDSDYAAVGGCVEPGDFKRSLDWAVFFCDYARYMAPFTGDVQALPGNNLSYKRTKLTSLEAKGQLDRGLYEVFINSQLLKAGEKLHAASGVCVKNINRWTISHATAVPFHHGRGFAAMRFPTGATGAKLLYAAASLMLPGLQTLRICHQVLSRKRYRGALLQALPAIILYWSSWSLGEFMGYLLGPGRSLEQWR